MEKNSFHTVIAVLIAMVLIFVFWCVILWICGSKHWFLYSILAVVILSVLSYLEILLHD